MEGTGWEREAGCRKTAFIFHLPCVRRKERRDNKGNSYTTTRIWRNHHMGDGWNCSKGRRKSKAVSSLLEVGKKKRSTGWTENSEERGPACQFLGAKESVKHSVQTKKCPNGKLRLVCIHVVLLPSFHEQNSKGDPRASLGAICRSLKLEKEVSNMLDLEERGKGKENPYHVNCGGIYLSKKKKKQKILQMN